MRGVHPWTGSSAEVRLGVLTEWVSVGLVDEVLAECGRRDQRPGALPARLMVYYVLALTRETEWEIVAACQAEGLGLLPWSPLAGGWLSGKYARDARPAGATRLGEDPERQFQAYDRRGRLEQTWQVLGEVRAVAAERGVSMAQVSLAWLVDRPGVSSVILGARTVEQLNENLEAAGLHLTPGETRRLDAASELTPADYPYGGPGSQQRSRAVPEPQLS
jgi:aryl-alcohol dehydrogenase-like predicted oxidoreductase